jgi:hypothetical protein
MIAVVIANAVLGLCVVAGIVWLHAWAILADKRAASAHPGKASASSRDRKTRPKLGRLEGALEFSA